jgi:transposase
MRTHSYPNDVTDAQRALIEPHIPVHPGGWPRKTELRDVVDAIFYIPRAGCQWRYLSRDFPPKSTVQYDLKLWRSDGTLDTIHELFTESVRTWQRPYLPAPRRASTTSRSTPPSGGEQKGRHNAKNIDGRKRHIFVDSMGLLLAVLVKAAAVGGAAAAPAVFAWLDGQPMSQVVRM